MYPTGLATSHPTSHTLQQHAMKGCPSKMGRHGTKEEMHAAREREETMYRRNPAVEAAYQENINERLARGQAKVVPEEDIKDNPQSS